jgi:hypothetical protein
VSYKIQSFVVICSTKHSDGDPGVPKLIVEQSTDCQPFSIQMSIVFAIRDRSIDIRRESVDRG